MALDGYAAVEKTDGLRDRRFGMEHADSLRAVHLPRCAQMHVVVSTQPEFCCGGASSKAKELPGNSWQSLLKSGAKLMFRSDRPCSWPPGPLAGISRRWRALNAAPGWGTNFPLFAPTGRKRVICARPDRRDIAVTPWQV